MKLFDPFWNRSRCSRQDSNLRAVDYESSALTTELREPKAGAYRDLTTSLLPGASLGSSSEVDAGDDFDGAMARTTDGESPCA